VSWFPESGRLVGGYLEMCVLDGRRSAPLYDREVCVDC
jgi:hypothetical protein